MDQKTTISQCGRGEDLVTFLYGEADEREASNFETHLHDCVECQSELAGFGQVHQSMVSWRDEILGGFVSNPVAVPVRKKSALLALREFFDLSPLWMKGAVGFAALLLCALAFLNVSKLGSSPTAPTINSVADAKYTQKQLDEQLAKAREEWNVAQPKLNDDKQGEVVISTPSPQPRPKVVREVVRPTRGRSPLSKSERDQLAADLRLLSTDNEDLTLIGERINQQF